MPDTAPSRILSLDTPSVLDLRTGQIEAIFAASVEDPDGVRQVTVYYDRELVTQSGAYSFQIIHGYGSDWTDGNHSYTAQILPHNVGGTLNITHVEIEDNLGNRTTISSSALQGLGVDTSITIRSIDPDTTAPSLTALELPDRIDLRNGNMVAEFFAAGFDPNQIDDVVIWFDREISRDYGSGSSSAYSFVGLYGYGTDDWSDGNYTEHLNVSAENYAGQVDIDRVEITDVYGNRRTYTNDELRALGFDTSFELVGTAAPAPTTYVASLPETITLREGQTANLSLNFVGMTNQWASYSYHTSTVGGTASVADIGEVSGSGYVNVVSTHPTNRQQSFSISASRDGTQENTETAFLVVELSGDMYFADGGQMQVVEIRIADDNRISGTVANDVLYGTSAAETLTGETGNDTYHVTFGDRIIEAENAGNDTVNSGFTYKLEAHVENLVLTGTGGLRGTGNSLVNRITGNAGNNILDGGLGADTLTGGSGNDTYLVDNVGDRVVEALNSGTDSVQSLLSWTLGANLENLTLTGSGHLNGTGNWLANRITGNAGNNILDGGFGADTLTGGAGYDTYVVDSTGDRVFEGLNGGTDSVHSSVNWTLGANLENLTMTGSGHLNGTGNALANTILGSLGNNVLNGAAGNDTLDGRAGNDRLNGGLGNDILNGGTGADRIIGGHGADRMTGSLGADVFVFQTLGDSTSALAGRDTIIDFNLAQGDRVDLSAIDARTNLVGNQAFNFIGSGAFTGTAGELSARSVATGTLIVADVNGDRVADLAIFLDDPITMSANGFLL